MWSRGWITYTINKDNPQFGCCQIQGLSKATMYNCLNTHPKPHPFYVQNQPPFLPKLTPFCPNYLHTKTNTPWALHPCMWDLNKTHAKLLSNSFAGEPFCSLRSNTLPHDTLRWNIWYCSFQYSKHITFFRLNVKSIRIILSIP